MNLNIVNAFQYIDGLQGYKLEPIHFRIGSKYHSDTFIHARILLQNSYYTSRVALILSKKINNLCQEKAIKTVTLVGYERYSELLLGLMKNFLQAMSPSLVVTTCIMADEGTMVPMKSPDTKFQHFFVIVPIVSTGNTAERIIKAYKKEASVDSDAVKVFHIFQLSPTGYSINIPNAESLMTIPVQWFEPHKCPMCFVDKKSLPLFEADKTHLNPVAIFGMPTVKTLYSINDDTKYQPEDGSDGKPRKISVFGCPFNKAIFTHSLEYHKDNHFNDFRAYSHISERFIQDNKNGIEKWIDALREDLGIKATDRVVILSPCHIMTNISFVNLVNNRLFGSSATVIYIEPGKEYPENFKRINQDFLSKESADKVKLFYVDDDLVTGRTFFQIYDLFRYSAGYGNVVLSAAIFLMNKAPADINERVSRASGRIHAFVAINLPQRYMVSDQGPFSREIKRYEDIMKRCLYYEQELAFKKKCESLQFFDQPENNRERHLQMFFATHVLFDYFSHTGVASLNGLSFDELFAECQKRDDRLKDRYAVLKVLTRNSFTMYKPIKDKVFMWTKDELSSVVAIINKNCDSSNWQDVTVLDELLFLIHRSVQMGNYQIVSNSFFELLSRVFAEIKEDGEMEKVTTVFGDKIVYAPKDFHNEILKRYVELIVANPAVAVVIQDAIKDVSFKPKDDLAFKSKLLDETYIVLQDLFEFIQAFGFLPSDHILNAFGNDFISFEGFEEKVGSWFQNNGIRNSMRFIWADLVAGKGDGALSDRFLQYLWLKSFVVCDRDDLLPKTDEMVEKKNNMLCWHLKKMVNPDISVGAFFVITDVLGKQRLVFDEDSRGYSALRNRFTDSEITGFFSKQFKGIDTNPESDSRVFVELEQGNDTDGILKILNAQKMLLFRIGGIHKRSVAGLIGFYSERIDALTSIGKRYMLLMRRDILQYIEHHRNDEFTKAVLIEERRKFAYLTGHGREVMLRLSWENKAFIPIIATQERLQGIFAGNQYEKKSIKELLDIFFPCQTLNETVAKSIVNDVETIAQYIYEHDTVELKEKPNYWAFEVTGHGNFEFNVDLLKYICFELILNAKKNRYQKCPDAYSRAFLNEESPFVKNSIGLSLSFEEKGVIISVSGTGPNVSEEIERRIIANTQIKEKEDISGLDLIIKLIREFNTLNRISIKKEKMGNSQVYKNIVSVSIQ